MVLYTCTQFIIEPFVDILYYNNIKFISSSLLHHMGIKIIIRITRIILYILKTSTCAT